MAANYRTRTDTTNSAAPLGTQSGDHSCKKKTFSHRKNWKLLATKPDFLKNLNKRIGYLTPKLSSIQLRSVHELR